MWSGPKGKRTHINEQSTPCTLLHSNPNPNVFLFIYLFILRLEGNTETSSLILKMAEILSQVQQYLPRDCCSPDDPINSVVTER